MSTINPNNHMNYNNEPLVRALGSQDANATKEVNNSKEYEWLKNRHGILVPIALHLIDDKLRRGFIRTDGKVYTDNPADQVQPPMSDISPAEAMTKLAEKLVEATATQTEVVKKLVRGRRKAKSTEVNENLE